MTDFEVRLRPPADTRSVHDTDVIECARCGHEHLRPDGWYEPCQDAACASEHAVGGKCWITVIDG